MEKILFQLYKTRQIICNIFYRDDDSQYKEFWQNMGMHNAAHVFTSLDAYASSIGIDGVKLYVFQFQNDLKHILASLLTAKRMPTIYSQLHTIDIEKTTMLRML